MPRTWLMMCVAVADRNPWENGWLSAVMPSLEVGENKRKHLQDTAIYRYDSTPSIAPGSTAFLTFEGEEFPSLSN